MTNGYPPVFLLFIFFYFSSKGIHMRLFIMYALSSVDEIFNASMMSLKTDIYKVSGTINPEIMRIFKYPVSNYQKQNEKCNIHSPSGTKESQKKKKVATWPWILKMRRQYLGSPRRNLHVDFKSWRSTCYRRRPPRLGWARLAPLTGRQGVDWRALLDELILYVGLQKLQRWQKVTVSATYPPRQEPKKVKPRARTWSSKQASALPETKREMWAELQVVKSHLIVTTPRANVPACRGGGAALPNHPIMAHQISLSLFFFLQKKNP